MNKKEYKTDGNTERRAISFPVTLEKREAEGESRKISGYAAVFEQKTKIGTWYEEQIARGAFDECDFSRCVLNFNHDDNNLLGRVSSGTLKLEIDEKGLRFECELPETTTANDILTLIRRGDIEGCSFAFVVRESSWEWLSDEDPAQLDQRTIMKISEVFDVSVVTHPAYEQTSVDARSAEAAREQHREELRQEEEEKEKAEAESQSRLRQEQTITLNII
ncbi:MAG: HK97 family phage prohead protease [Oscillospiraceae bacterium]|nr:HK97 family phage prohead protease [Oscillospiraceae bacterium]